jgi:hypothetical protein
MTSTTKIVIVLLSCGASTVARAAIPTSYAPLEGTILSTHIPPSGECPTTQWHFGIGPNGTVQGSIFLPATRGDWRLSGTYDSHGTFHLHGQELGGAARTNTVDAQVQSNGSLTMRIATTGDPSPCGNRTVYLPWFRNGNDFDPAEGTELGF